jgi:hypothetical protein
MIRAARAMAMATGTKRAMVTNRDNTGNGNIKEGGEQAMAGTMAMGRVKDMAAQTTSGERGMMVVMGHGLCVSFWVSEEMTKNKDALSPLVNLEMQHDGKECSDLDEKKFTIFMSLWEGKRDLLESTKMDFMKLRMN